MLSCLRAKFQRFKGFEIFFESGSSSEKARIREFKSGGSNQRVRINEFKIRDLK